MFDFCYTVYVFTDEISFNSFFIHKLRDDYKLVIPFYAYSRFMEKDGTTILLIFTPKCYEKNCECCNESN